MPDLPHIGDVFVLHILIILKSRIIINESLQKLYVKRFRIFMRENPETM